MILGTLLLLLLIGAAAVGAWKYRSTVLGGDDRSAGAPLSDELLVALAKEHDRRRA